MKKFLICYLSVFLSLMIPMQAIVEWELPAKLVTGSDVSMPLVGIPKNPLISLNSNGTAVAVWYQVEGVTHTMKSALFQNGAWSALPDIATAGASIDAYQALALNIDEEGNALVVFASFDGISPIDAVLMSSTFNGTSWSSPTTIETFTNAIALPSCSINNNLNAALIFSDANDTFKLRTFDGSSWADRGSHTFTGANVEILNFDIALTDTNQVVIGVIYNSQIFFAKAQFALGSNIVAFNGSFISNLPAYTQSIIQVDVNLSLFSEVQVAANAAGQALLVYQASGGISGANFNGSWSGPTVLQASGDFPQVGIDQNGDGIAVWTSNSLNEIQGSRFMGSTWQALPAIGPAVDLDVRAGVPLLFNNPAGEFITVWATATGGSGGQVLAAQFNGDTFNAPELLFESDTQFPGFLNLFPINAVGSGDFGSAIVCWGMLMPGIGGMAFDVYAVNCISGLELEPPSNLQACCLTNRFLTQSEKFVRLTWRASPSKDIAKYFIFRDGCQIGCVPANNCNLCFEDHNICVAGFYQVSAVDCEGNQSEKIGICQ